MYLDYAENQAKRNIAMSMAEWIGKLDAFLSFNDYSVLRDPGKLSHEIAAKMAEDQYGKFRIIQDQLYKSDFDKIIQRLPKRNKKTPDT
jgi:hypothetical protein